MSIVHRACGLILALSLALPVVLPSTARAEDDDATNEIVAYGLLAAVIGILVYVGWKMDKQDKEPLTRSNLKEALAAADDNDGIRLVCPPAREGEQVAGIGYGLSF